MTGDPVAATIAAIRQGTPTVKVFTLAVPTEQFSYLAGQWVDCYVEVDGDLLVGGYSLTSTPLDHGTVELAIKAAREHPVTRHLHERARVGDEMVLVGGQGTCVYTPGMAPALVLVAGGIGITPLMSIIRTAYRAEAELPITLIYGAATPEELLFRNELAAMASARAQVRCVFLTSRATMPPPPGVERGRVDRRWLERAGIPPAAVCFVSGPRGMIGDVARDLATCGVDATRVRYERWW